MFNPKENLLDQQLAESGIQLTLEIGGALLGIGSSIIGGLFGSNQASAQRRAAEKQAKKQYEYDTKKYEANKLKLKADRDYLVEKIETDERNFDRTRLLQDQLKLDTYGYQLQIRNREQDALDRQFAKSDELYNEALTLNARENQLARDSIRTQMRETIQSAAFEQQNAILDAIQAEGQLKARGASGRSIAKAQQSLLSDFGRGQAALAASIVSAQNNMTSQLSQVQQDYEQANIQAYANRMLEPTAIPEPLVPYTTPDMEFMLPRELEDFDFGPEPIKGVVASVSPGAVFAQTALSGIGQAASALASSGVFSGSTPGASAVPASLYQGQNFSFANTSYQVPSSATPTLSF